jgi:EAL domain-containing protein (putative c-di-GMP-specific phosphodiesterase class I)
MRVVEASDQLGPFARRLLNRAVAAVAEWRRQGVDLPVSVPISARLLLDETLANDVRDLLDRHGVPATNLILEISETVVMSDLRIVDEVLAGLAALGVQLSVDDFGTGYSSLTFLTRIAVDEIKVDRQFVREMDTSPAASAIVSTTADLGRRLGLRIVADGVETAEQRWQLARLGVTGAQGPAVARTEPESRILATLRQLSPPDGIAESPSGRATA